MRAAVAVIVGLLCLAPIAAIASPTACPLHYSGGEAPEILSAGLAAKVREICKEAFGIFHSGVAAVPLWSAQHLTRAGVIAAKSVDRVDRFFADPALPESERSELDHYRGSGYDRGHMAPSADMPTQEAQSESFSLANISPQYPDLNRRLWAHIEATARGIALAYGEAYVVTGVAFEGGTLSRIGSRVLVPTAIWKAIYIPSAEAASAWWAANAAPGDIYEVISVDELLRRTGIDAFPELDPIVKGQVVKLPEPSPANDRIRFASQD